MSSRNNVNNEVGTLYSPLVGVVFVFNLIVGTGALAMPYAFSKAGYVLSSILVGLIAISSYMTVTLVIETMACANAQLRLNTRRKKMKEVSRVSVNTTNSESQPLLGDTNEETIEDEVVVNSSHWYEITDRVELGQMVSMFYNKVGITIFYVCIVVYLYGDLAIYAVAVPNSLKTIFCDTCWSGVPSISRMDAYRVYVAAFFLCLGVFTFFDVQKTKLLQIFTTILRWTAFIAMISLAIVQITSEGDHVNPPPPVNFSYLPNLFGVCVYSFMCHHSLPSLATPMRNKSNINTLFFIVYLFILIFYLLMSLTGAFAFPTVDSLYTLNFSPRDGSTLAANIPFLEYFISLFPVFTLSASFPIITITLRNNLKTLFMLCRNDRPYPRFIDKIAFPLAVLIPPAIIAMITDDVSLLVGITGSFPGAAIQYFIPVTLAYCARKQMLAKIGPQNTNQHRSLFNNIYFAIPLLLWALVCVGFVLANFITKPADKDECSSGS